MRKTIWILSVVLVLCVVISTFAQNAAVPKDSKKLASLLFREDFKAGKEHEVQFTQDLLTNPNLELKKRWLKPNQNQERGNLYLTRT